MLLGTPISPLTLEDFMNGGSTEWIFYLVIMSAVLYSNMSIYEIKKARAEQKKTARLNSKFALLLYFGYIVGNFLTESFPVALNYIAGFTFLWSAIETYRFTRTKVRLAYFDKLGAHNDSLHLLFINCSVVKILDREFTLESLRLVLRNHNEYSEKILSKVEKMVFGKWVEDEVKKAILN
jgi:hypothetical protein